MLNLCTLLSTLFVLVIGMCFLSTGSEAMPRSIAVERRDADVSFDNILGELKSKGSRMRFGKRAAKQDSAVFDHLDNYYFPDRFLWLQ
ncbi:hypothetical protein M3Y97_00596200 [Aphelenchoides bicaudatus]|nr:hypothetical protein M3Y97_00596200 [Aphelenchoides bicaudatus]